MWLLFSNFVSVIATKAVHSTIKRRNVKEIKIVTDLVPSHIIIRKSEFTVDDLDTASQVIDCKSSTRQDKIVKLFLVQFDLLKCTNTGNLVTF